MYGFFREQLLPLAFAFDDSDVPVDRQILETLQGTARLRPLHFHPIDLGPLSEAEDHARVVIREIASSGDFELMTFKISGAIADFGADCVNIAFAADEAEPEPVVAAAGVILEQDGGAIADRGQRVYRAIVIEVADGETTPGDVFREDRAALLADILKAAAGIAEEHHRFRIGHTGDHLIDIQFGMAIA